MNSPPNSNRPAPPGGRDKSHAASPGVMRRHGVSIGIGVVMLAAMGTVTVLFITSEDAPPPRQVRELTIVTIQPPPPPPPPPPPKPLEPKMIEQPKMTEPEIKEEMPVEKPKDAPPKDAKNDEPPPGPLALAAKAQGPGDLFNLGGNPGGRGLLGGGGGGGGSRWGWYVSIVQQQIESALRANAKTRNAVMQMQVRFWADSSGRVTRVQIVSSGGSPEIDAAIRDEVLPGIVLREPPPKDMPMPMVAKLSARRPS